MTLPPLSKWQMKGTVTSAMQLGTTRVPLAGGPNVRTLTVVVGPGRDLTNETRLD
jgi:hypothetical protein